MSQPSNPYDSPDSGRAGMSGSTKVILGVGIGCGLLLLLCCGGMMLSGYFFAQSAQNAVSKDPARVREVTAEIVEITVPETLPPMMSMDWTIPLVNKKFMSMAAYGEEEHGTNNLIVMQFGDFIGDEKQMQTQFNTQMRGSGQQEWGNVELEETEIVKQTVNGEETRFTLGRGKNDKSDADVWQVTGTFKGKGGPAMLMMQGETEKFTKEQVLAIIQSMH